MEKATLGFRIFNIWQILKRFTGTFGQAQTLKLGGVIVVVNFNPGIQPGFFLFRFHEIFVLKEKINKHNLI